MRSSYWFWVCAVALLGSWLHSPVLHAGHSLDDFAQTAMLTGDYPVARDAWDLYTFSTGERHDVAELLERGFYPWWAHPRVRLSMFRPLASVLRWADYRWLGGDALLAHLHSLCHWLALLFAVAALFARTLPPRAALLATLFFALDQAHPINLGWLAARTAIVSACFGALALTAYLRHREHGTRRAAWLACGFYGVALAAGEYALCWLAYALAYEWLARGEALRARVRALGWLLAPAALYMLTRAGLGGGARHSGIYLDPLSEPIAFGAAAFHRFPVLLADALGCLRAEHWSFGAPWLTHGPTTSLAQAGLPLDRGLGHLTSWRTQHELIAVAIVVAGVVALSRVARSTATTGAGHAVWLSCGGALATLPLVGSLPGSRLLLVPEVGAAALVAALVVHLAGRLSASRGRPLARLWRASACVVVVGLHGVLAPLQARSDGQILAALAPRIRQAVLAAPLPSGGARKHRAVVVATGDPTLTIYMRLIRKLAGLPAPASIWVLSGNRFPATLVRTDARTLELHYAPGASLLTEPFEQMFRSPSEGLRAGARVRLSALEVAILRADAGRPTALRFTFDRPLEDPSWSFWIPTHQALRRFVLPKVGARVELPPPVAPLN